MMNKKLIVFATLIIVAAIATGSFLSGCRPSEVDLTSLSLEQKSEILEAYKIEMCGGEFDKDGEFYRRHPLVWFDENGGRRNADVFRYFGTYGDCIVLLRYGDNVTALFEPIKPPCPLYGLSRTVDFPIECEVILYHTNPNYPKHDAIAAPITSLLNLEYLQLQWLTDAQLEQLTDDLEIWVANGNY